MRLLLLLMVFGILMTLCFGPVGLMIAVIVGMFSIILLCAIMIVNDMRRAIARNVELNRRNQDPQL